MTTLRKTLFAGWLAIFIVICPLMVLYTLHYLQAGVAVLNTMPEGATVTLNGQVQTKKTPAILSDLSSGTYSLLLQKEGVRDYQLNLHIEEGEATVLNQILLLSDKIEWISGVDEAYDTLVPIPGSGYFLLMHSDRKSEAKVFCAEDNTSYPLFPTRVHGENIKIDRVTINPGSTVVIVNLRKNNKRVVYRMDVKKHSSEVLDLTNLVTNGNGEYLWSADKPDWLFCYHNEKIELIDLKRKSKVKKFAEDWVGMGLGKHTVFGVNANGKFFQTDYSGKMLEAETTEFQFRKGLFGRTSFVRILPMDHNQVLLHEVNGPLWQSQLPNLLTDRTVKGLLISPHSENVAVWTAQDLGIRFPEVAHSTSKIFNEGLKIHWLVEGASEILCPTFILNGSKILYAQDGQVWLHGLDLNRDVPRDVMKIMPGTAFHFSESQGGIYGLDPESGRLIFFRLFPAKPKGHSDGVMTGDIS
ncbi:PEGA domain-containing protein [Kiritimatiellaeota bacterium B1221]|nr:PEGA domain-containing protein [Kiritimatiellaeota bacterium B1221]